jgi:hypothetical protein
MNDTPTLYACNSRLDLSDKTGRTLAVILTPLGATNTVSADQKMCEEILTGLRINRAVTGWRCAPFRTRYYESPEAPESDRWRVAWDVFIQLDKSLLEVPRQKYDCFEINEGGAYSLTPTEELKSLNYRGIADFQDAGSAEKALEEFQESNNGLFGSRHNLGDQFIQIMVDLGRGAQDIDLIPLETSAKFEAICKKYGGICNKTEREDLWDIVYNQESG